MRTLTRLLVLSPLIVAVAACGSDGDSTDEAATDGADVTTPSVAADESDTTTEVVDESVAPPPAGGGDGGGATLSLSNGETIEFPSVLCSLEPQMSAGSEILFTAVSYDDPSLDITQFGDEGTITGVASISVYDADFETLWEANSMFGSPVELTLDGSTIRGTGSFLAGGEMGGETVDGEVVANC